VRPAPDTAKLGVVTAPDIQRPLRTEGILIGAIGLVLLVVVALAVILWSGERAHRQERAIYDRVRAARAELLDAWQAQNEAEVAAARYRASGDRALLAEFNRDKRAARMHLAGLRAILGEDPDALGFVERIERLVERRFDVLAAEADARPGSSHRPELSIYAAFREESAALLALFNARIDAARAAQEANRQQINLVALTLAALTLIASALAIFVLRRERQQWLLAHAATEAARAQAAAADLAKSRFLAVASHDMRQPLHALTLYLSALERRVESAEARDIISKMDRATQSMIGMFSMLLDLARMQAGVVTPDIAEAALQDVFDRIGAEHPDGKVEVTPTPLAARTDPLLLERILSNLVANALKHGGGKARLSARIEDGAAVIEVADDGPGIPVEEQERVFEEFVRLGAGGRGEGLGLGLAIVKRTADLLGADLRLQSAAGQGARFFLRLPLASAPDVQKRAGAGDTLRGVPVLIMDDEPLAREAMTATLSDLGAHVRACANGEDVAAALDQGFAPRLLLMDLRINGELRGIAIADSARARLDPPPRAIIITGDTGPDTLAALRASGHAWLIKPVDPRDLSAAAAAQLQPSSP
jgi:signal transduction histidine kinase